MADGDDRAARALDRLEHVARDRARREPLVHAQLGAARLRDLRGGLARAQERAREHERGLGGGEQVRKLRDQLKQEAVNLYNRAVALQKNGNLVEARLSSRTDGQLPQAEVELSHSRGPLLGEPLPAAAIEWATALTATALPEGQPFPRLYEALDGLLAAIEAAPTASGWGVALVRFELLLLAELGFGLDLERCALTGATQSLSAVSPKPGRAVSALGAEPYADRLLPLPAFLLEGGSAAWGDILDGLQLTGHFLTRDVLTDRAATLLAGRERLAERLRRAAGLA